MIKDKYQDARTLALREMLIQTASQNMAQTPATRVRRRAVVGLAAFGLTLGLATPVVIGAIEAEPQQAVQPPQTASELPPPTHNVFADYEPFASPSDMAQGAPVVFSGVIQTVTTISELTGVPATTQSGEVAILVVEEVQVAKGAVDTRPDGSVLFALQGYRVGDGISLATLKEVLPRETGVVAYAQRGWFADNQWGISNVPPTTMNTAEQSLYTLWTPQGLAVQLPGSGHVQWPYLGDSQPGLLMDVLPGGNLIGID